MNLLELDALAHRMIRERGAESCYIDYHPSFGAIPFGKVLCTSVNDAVLHGLPHDYVLRDGDLLSVDFAASVDGWVSDSALSAWSSARRGRRTCALIEATDRALAAGIEAARAGNRIGDISLAIGEVARVGRATGSTPQFGGHGVGRTMHGDPHIPNDGRPGRGFPLRARPRHRDRAVVPAHDRRDLHRRRRLDAPQRRRVARRAHGAHGRRHRGRAAGPDRPHGRSHTDRWNASARPITR